MRQTRNQRELKRAEPELLTEDDSELKRERTAADTLASLEGSNEPRRAIDVQFSRCAAARSVVVSLFMLCPYDKRRCNVCSGRCDYEKRISELFKAGRRVSLNDRKIIIDEIRRQLVFPFTRQRLSIG